MLASLEISINIILLGVITFTAAALGFLINAARVKKQQNTILKLESEMLHNHAEILQLQKEISDKENPPSTTPIFSIMDNAPELLKEQTPGRLTKKISGGGKSTS